MPSICVTVGLCALLSKNFFSQDWCLNCSLLVIADKDEAEQLINRVGEALSLLNDYNARLAAEMEDRKKLKSMLHDFLHAQKELLLQAEKRHLVRLSNNRPDYFGFCIMCVCCAGVHREAGQGAAGERGAQIAPAESARDELRGRWLVGAAPLGRGSLPGLSQSSAAASGFYSLMPVDKKNWLLRSTIVTTVVFLHPWHVPSNTQIKSFAQLLLCKISI